MSIIALASGSRERLALAKARDGAGSACRRGGPSPPTRSPGPRAVAPDQLSGGVGPADDRHAGRKDRRGDHVAAREHGLRSPRRAPRRRAPARAPPLLADRGGDPERDVRLARLAPIAARSESAPASARQPTSSGLEEPSPRGGSARPRPSRRRRSRTAHRRTHDRGVVADPAHDRDAPPPRAARPRSRRSGALHVRTRGLSRPRLGRAQRWR